MTSSSFSRNRGTPFVADASVIINLVAARKAGTIVDAFPNRFLVTTSVRDELWEGRGHGHGSWESLEALIGDGSIEAVDLKPSDDPVYRSLIEGEARATLDDGEAATIAYAVGRDAVALIDERKARRICDARFPTLRLVSTADLLLHGLVTDRLGADGQSDAIFRTLRDARMQVVPRDRIREVVERIGAARAAECPSLPRWARAVRGTDRRSAGSSGG